MSRHLTRRQAGGVLLGAAGLAMLAPAAIASSRHHRVTIQRFRFEPASLTIRPGDTVEWVNLDIAPHTATAKGERPWDTGRLRRNDTAKLVFPEAGRWSYICAYHPQMRAEIIVETA